MERGEISSELRKKKILQFIIIIIIIIIIILMMKKSLNFRVLLGIRNGLPPLRRPNVSVDLKYDVLCL